MVNHINYSQVRFGNHFSHLIPLTETELLQISKVQQDPEEQILPRHSAATEEVHTIDKLASGTAHQKKDRGEDASQEPAFGSVQQKETSQVLSYYNYVNNHDYNNSVQVQPAPVDQDQTLPLAQPVQELNVQPHQDGNGAVQHGQSQQVQNQDMGVQDPNPQPVELHEFHTLFMVTRMYCWQRRRSWKGLLYSSPMKR